MKNIGYYNGKVGPLEEMTVPMDDRALYFGDGVYDVATLIDGKFFAIEDHIDRFFHCCTLMEMPLPITEEQFRQTLNELRAMLDPEVTHAVFYFQASRGIAPRNHPFPVRIKPSIMITVKPMAAPDYTKTGTIIAHPDLRFRMCHIKTINLIPNVLASQRAREAGATEAVLHKDGRVTECAHSGIFILKNGTVITPPLNNEILPSITRKHLVEICKTNNIPLEERFFTLADLRSADEAMLMSTTKLLMPVTAFDGIPMGGRDPELRDRLVALYKDYLEAHLTEN